MTVTQYNQDIGHGAPVQISGRELNVAAACNTGATTTAQIDKTGFAFGSMRIPNGSSITTVTWYAAAYGSDTAVPLKDSDGVAAVQTVAADEVHEIHPAVAGCKFALPVVDAAGTIYFHWER